MSERDFKLYMAEDVRAVVEQLPARQRSAFINDAVRHYSSKAQDLLAFGEWLAGGEHADLGAAIVRFYEQRSEAKKRQRTGNEVLKQITNKTCIGDYCGERAAAGSDYCAEGNCRV